MAPVIRELERDSKLRSIVCATGQHRDMLDSVLSFFAITPSYNLQVMRPSQTLAELTGRVLDSVYGVLRRECPDLVLVHGDTTSCMAGALASYYARIPVGHVEAGLRTGNPYSPWPEEINRKLTAGVARFHFAPTTEAKANLLSEGIPAESIAVTGNTVVDALMLARERIHADVKFKQLLADRFSFLNEAKRLILVTGHRRENFGNGFKEICEALIAIADRGDTEVLYPVHLNPSVKTPVEGILSNRKGIHLIEPQDYPTFVYLIERSYLVLTDSGGVQEEAPSFGKPVLVLRDTTERPEAIEAGTVRLVGADRHRIVKETSELLDSTCAYSAMARAHNPYGDGHAAERIVTALHAL